MDLVLPVVFMGIMGLAMLIYVILDGYDLGIGMLLPLGDDEQKDIMIASIGPFWDANETWIVLGVGILLIAFPKAHGMILTFLYIPVSIMLLGLILRGVAFDFRVKAGANKKHRWDKAFFGGSLIASIAQGWMLGAYITGLENNTINTLFSALIALALPALYVVLGAAWLLIKTENELQKKAIRWAKVAVWPMAAGLVLVSVATPLVSSGIADKWFTMPNLIGLLPIPVICLVAFSAILWGLYHKPIILGGYEWIIYVAAVLICIMGTIGLAYSLYPDIVIGQLTIWEAASATESLTVVLIGTSITLPMILIYTVMVYKIFGGKATNLRYDSSIEKSGSLDT